MESDDEVMAIGSGGPYALAAARALIKYSELSAAEIAQEALSISADICIYTNKHITLEELDTTIEPGTKIRKTGTRKQEAAGRE